MKQQHVTTVALNGLKPRYTLYPCSRAMNTGVKNDTGRVGNPCYYIPGVLQVENNYDATINNGLSTRVIGTEPKRKAT